MATLGIAEWASGLSRSDLPESTREAAKRSYYNWLGCAIGGATHPTVNRAYEATRPFFGQARCKLLGRADGYNATDALHAALLTGIASHVHDYDDTHLATIIHPTGPVASALTAYAQWQASSSDKTEISGEDFLLALTAGIEVSCKLGLSIWPSHYDIGWHITSTTGSIGAAVAVGKLKGLSSIQIAHAIGLASTTVTGLREMFGSDTKSYHVGEAAMNGFRAASLAERGLTSSTQALEARRGWANVTVGNGMPQLDRFVGELGSTWEIERNSYKPFPCGIVCHPAIDASIQVHGVMEERGVDARQIVAVSSRVHPLVIELTSKRRPRDGLEGKFSVFHGCAVGLLYGQASPTEYTDEVVNRAEVISLRDKVDATQDEAMQPDEVCLRVEFSDGQEIERHVRHAVGSLDMPMTDAQLKSKFVAQCRTAYGDAAEALSARVWGLQEVASVAALMA